MRACKNGCGWVWLLQVRTALQQIARRPRMKKGRKPSPAFIRSAAKTDSNTKSVAEALLSQARKSGHRWSPWDTVKRGTRNRNNGTTE